MKLSSKICLLGLAMALSQGCGSSAEDKRIQEEKLESTNAISDAAAGSAFVESKASKVTKLDSTRKFIRTADIKFKVKNVEQSTYRIEDIVSHFEGFVTNTTLNCRINYTNEFRIKQDSVLRRTHFVVENNLTFRVPNTLLDTTLKQITSQIDFLDYRIIKAEDVSFQALKNSLSEKRFSKHEQSLTTAINNNKTKDVVKAENNLFSKQEQADENAVASLELKDKIAYSTVQILIYQDEKIRDERIFSEEQTPSYKPSFGKEFGDSILIGWQFFEQLILFFVKIWPIVLIGIGVFFFVRFLIKRKA